MDLSVSPSFVLQLPPNLAWWYSIAKNPQDMKRDMKLSLCHDYHLIEGFWLSVEVKIINSLSFVLIGLKLHMAADFEFNQNIPMSSRVMQERAFLSC